MTSLFDGWKKLYLVHGNNLISPAHVGHRPHPSYAIMYMMANGYIKYVGHGTNYQFTQKFIEEYANGEL